VNESRGQVRLPCDLEEMISLLDSGIDIKDLFAFLAAKQSGAA
jgi:hypothetical protein